MILMLIFILQTVWVFIDEFAGKGLDLSVILRFLLYYSPKLIPLVLPLTVLLASIMTFGNFAERYEFAAMKSAGISLFRAMRVLIVLNVLLTFITFYIANTVIPYAEFKTYNLRKNLAKMRPALAITEGLFNEIGDNNIKVADKYGKENRFLKDVIVHQKNKQKVNTVVIKAKEGKLESDNEFNDGLQLLLFEGNRYEEIITKKSQTDKKYPHTRVEFGKYTMNIDLGGFNDVDLRETKYNNTYKMQNILELQLSIDSLDIKLNNEVEGYAKTLYSRIGIKSLTKSQNNTFEGIEKMLALYEKRAQISILNQSNVMLKSTLDNVKSQKKVFFLKEKVINLHKIWLYDKYAIAFSAILMFFVGAPLGAIIRKGGFGLPAVVALFIFLSYHFLGTLFKNSAEDGSMSSFLGTWITSFVLTILALFLVRQASSDKSFFDFNAVKHRIGFIFTHLFHFLKQPVQRTFKKK